MPEPQARRGFQTPPEVLSYFGDKGLRPAFSWQDVWGQGFETWREGMTRELARLGWAGPRTVKDPSGAWSPKEVDFADPRRLRTTFWANVNSARSAGQWERAQRTKAALPYALYVRSASTDPRREHLGWVGIILPVDHPWWKTHWPPNGWGCKCSIRMITSRERDRLLAAEPKPGGIRYTTEPPDDGPPQIFTNKRTGEISEVPAGIDPGWQTNPGLSRARTVITRLEERVREAGEEDARAAIAEIWQTPLPRIVAGLPEAERVSLPIAVSRKAQAALATDSPLVSITRDTLADHMRPDRPRPTTQATYAEAQALIDAGTPVDRGQNNRVSMVAEREDGWWSTTIARSAAGFMRVVSVHRLRAEQALKFLRRDADGRP